LKGRGPWLEQVAGRGMAGAPQPRSQQRKPLESKRIDLDEERRGRARSGEVRGVG